MSFLHKFIGFCTLVILINAPLISPVFAGGDGSPQLIVQNKRPMARTVDVVYQKGPWRLDIYINNKGSRSEGSMGRLYRNGKQIQGREGEIRETSIGKVKYNGSEASRRHLWDDTGWQMVDPRVEPQVFSPRHLDRPRPVIPGKDTSQLDREMDALNTDN